MKSPPACPRRCWTSGELSAVRKVPARGLGSWGEGGRAGGGRKNAGVRSPDPLGRQALVVTGGFGC